MCTITITGYTAIPISPSQIKVTVNGTATPSGGSTCTEVKVCAGCGPVPVCVTVPVAGGSWSAVITTIDCKCSSTIKITATCAAGGTCSDTLTTPITCDCCPTVSITPTIEPCIPAIGATPVSFSVSVTVPPQCGSTTVQLNFGDGNFGTTQTFGPGTNVYTDTHDYASGNTYTACLDVSVPTGCTPTCITLVIPPCNCCPTITVSAFPPTACNNNEREVTFTATVTPNSDPNCPLPIQVQWNYGDGNFGPVHTITSTTTFTESHNYVAASSPYTVTACLEVITPTGCSSACVNVTIDHCPCCPVLTNLQIVKISDCNNSGQRQVTLSALVTIPAGCPSADVQWAFGDGSFSPVTTVTSTTTISVSHLYVANGTPYNACLNVITPSNCPSTCISLSLKPCPYPCCPIISTSVTESDCDSSGNFTATLNYNITVPASCPPAVVQWTGQPASYYAPGFSYAGPPFTSTYNVSSVPVTETLNVIAPPGCPGASVTINAPSTTNCNNAKHCHTPFFTFICPLLLNIAMYGLAFTLACVLLSTCPGLSTISSSLLIFGGIVGGLAILAFIFWIILCRRCAPCGALLLLLWRVFFEVGLIYAIFAGCCGGAAGFLIGLGMAALGLLFLTLWANQCKKDFCETLGEILIALTVVVAFEATLTSHFPLLNGCLYIVFGSTTFFNILTALGALIAALYVRLCGAH